MSIGVSTTCLKYSMEANHLLNSSGGNLRTQELIVGMRGNKYMTVKRDRESQVSTNITETRASTVLAGATLRDGLHVAVVLQSHNQRSLEE